MKFLLLLTVLSSCLLVHTFVEGSTTSPPPTIIPTTDCTTITAADTCCNTTGCEYFNCTVQAESTGCNVVDFNITGTDCVQTCTNGSEPTTPEPSTSTVAPTTLNTSTTVQPTSSPTTTEDKTSPSAQVPTEPTTTTQAANEPASQHFDAASFIGGIVLCGGLIAIAFFGCKFYKARSDKNYHTL